MSAIKITKENFDSEVLQSTKPVLLDFWADWCTPCKMLSPIIDELAEDHPEMKVGKVNVDEEKELAEQFKIMSIPTLLVFRSGDVVKRSTGLRTKAEVLEMLLP
ncbi:MAG: thioredoxin [Oscillospiraceae bacterium]|nr:thioredoxin [Oscillospiraceae bacterium]